MHTLLFDIDGTLIRSGGAGFDAMRIAMSQMFEINEIPEVEVHGRTDRGIVGEIFEKASLDYDQHGVEFSQRYWQHLPQTLAASDGEVLPGVVELLADLRTIPTFALGLLTGNAKRAAEIKLTHFGLDSFFDFGGFGDDFACRNEVAQSVLEAARSHLGHRFDPHNVWVIGDTIHDIRCARSIGSKVITVETGGATPEQLKTAEPDCAL